MHYTNIDPRYPIGHYEPQPFSRDQLKTWLDDIELLPKILEASLQGLEDEHFDTPYRAGGWTIRQVVHHIADAHLNGYAHFKWALTEVRPAVKLADERLWAEMNDVAYVPPGYSVTLLHGLHARWYCVLEELASDDWARTVSHPLYLDDINVWFLLGYYAWHGKHHVAQISNVRIQQGWD